MITIINLVAGFLLGFVWYQIVKRYAPTFQFIALCAVGVFATLGVGMAALLLNILVYVYE